MESHQLRPVMTAASPPERGHEAALRSATAKLSDWSFGVSN